MAQDGSQAEASAPVSLVEAPAGSQAQAEVAAAAPAPVSQAQPPAGSQAQLPAGSQSLPPAGSQALPPAGSQSLLPAGSQALPPAGSQAVPPPPAFPPGSHQRHQVGLGHAQHDPAPVACVAEGCQQDQFFYGAAAIILEKPFPNIW